jgi:hypothetical protein|tara:strand:+ start:55 stop:477 length:423 start_codon:yes stop_codon:yes gene_type:complete
MTVVNLTDILTDALKPHKETLKGWSVEDIGLLFMGFGNISIYPNETSEFDNDADFGGTFVENSNAIVQALNNIGIDISESDWDASDMYWLIQSYSGDIRSDLISIINNAGYSCYIWFDAEEENFEAETLSGWEPSTPNLN